MTIAHNRVSKGFAALAGKNHCKFCRQESRQTVSGRKRAMKEKPNPIEGSGKRNLFCAHYSNCLDHAVMKLWADWDCTRCPGRFYREPFGEQGWTDGNSLPYYILPSEIYQKVA